jgi:hypothetical protein
LLNSERGANYLLAGKSRKGTGTEEEAVTFRRKSRTSSQMRRLKHKGSSRKTHEHDRSEGQAFRCPRCQPFPWKVPALVRPDESPRDWSPKA